MKVPFIAIGNDELTESLGSHIICERCGKRHKVKYGMRVLEDGTKVPSKTIAFVRCGGSTYLAGVNGKRWRAR